MRRLAQDSIRAGLLALSVCALNALTSSAYAYSPMPIPDIDHTDLHKAAEGCHTNNLMAAMDALSVEDKDAEINRVDREGYTPLAYAAQNGCMEAVKVLIKSGAAVDAADVCLPWTPLHRAAEKQNAAIVRYLLKHRANANAKAGSLGQTPLTQAILGPYYGEDSQAARGETVKALLAAGADVNLPGRSGWTPLMTAVFRGDAGLTRLLINKGADLRAKDENGKMALDHAEERNEKKVAQILKSRLLEPLKS